MKDWWRRNAGPFGLSSLACASLVACATSGDLSLGSFPDEEGPSGLDNLGGAAASGGASSGSLGGSDGLGGSGVLLPCSPGGPLPAPARRYDFSGTGPEIVDVQGGEAGQIVGDATLEGEGTLTVDGDDYVDLPNGLLGSGDSASILIWVTPQPGATFSRIFDFGTSTAGEDPGGYSEGTYYVALSPETKFGPSGLAILIGRGGRASQDRALSAVDVRGEPMVAAVVLDAVAERLQLYSAGEVVGEGDLSGPLSEIENVNNWLGRSQYSVDPYFQGSYDELRIYEQALSGCEVSVLTALGPDQWSLP